MLRRERAWLASSAAFLLSGCIGSSPHREPGTAACADVAAACSEPGAICADDDTILACVLRPDGCLEERRTDCTAALPRCSALGGPARCEAASCDDIAEPDRCSRVGVTSCAAGNVLTSCERRADRCLELVRTACAGECSSLGGPAFCVVPPCASTPLDCPPPGEARRVMDDLASGSNAGVGWCGRAAMMGPLSAGRERVYEVRPLGPGHTTIVASASGVEGPGLSLAALEAAPTSPGDYCAAASDPALCLADTTLSLTARVEAGTSAYLAVEEAYLVAGSYPFELTLECITCGDDHVGTREDCDDGGVVPGDGCSSDCTVEPGWECLTGARCARVVCGDGRIGRGEACDDDGTAPGDGCDSLCAVEPGYSCTASPSACTLVEPSAICSGARVLAPNSATALALALGAPSPSGAGCATDGTARAIWAEVVIPPRSVLEVLVSTTGGADVVLDVVDTCASATCVASIDAFLLGAAESLRVPNATLAARTVRLAVGARDASAPAAALLTLSARAIACGDGVTDPGESCDDGAVAPGDGCDASCALEGGFSCVGAPSRCWPVAPHGLCSGALPLVAPSTRADDLALGGATSAPVCGARAERTLFYTVPDGVRVLADSSVADLALAVAGDCTLTSCAAFSDGRGVGGTEVLYVPTDAAPGALLLVRAIGREVGAVTIDVAVPACGDGVLDPGESCDDGGVALGDGCDAGCDIDPGWGCTGSPSVCQLECGDGALDRAEECDPGGAMVVGCAACTIAPGYYCDRLPAVCVPSVCGDGTVGPGEGCDDGGTGPGDGCSARCARELSAGPRGTITVSGSLTMDDPIFTRPSFGCAASTGDYYLDTVVVENASGTPGVVRGQVSSMLGLFGIVVGVERWPLNLDAPVSHCLAVGTMESGALSVTAPIAAGERVVFMVTSGFMPRTTGDWTLTVSL